MPRDARAAEVDENTGEEVDGDEYEDTEASVGEEPLTTEGRDRSREEACATRYEETPAEERRLPTADEANAASSIEPAEGREERVDAIRRASSNEMMLELPLLAMKGCAP